MFKRPRGSLQAYRNIGMSAQGPIVVVVPWDSRGFDREDMLLNRHRENGAL